MTETSPAARRARRGTLALAAAVATAGAAIGATALALPASAASDSQERVANGAPPKLEITDGTLTWGVKERFRKYVTGPIAHGKIETAEGASQAPGNGPFTFTGGKGSYDLSTHAVDTTFKGGVRFTGHEGQLDLKFSDVKVRTQGTKGSIVVDVTASGKLSDDVVFANLDLTGLKPGSEGGMVTYADIPATLTADGAKAFLGFYKEGDPLDPATLSVKAGGAPPTRPTPTPTQPTERPTTQPTTRPTTQPTGTPTTKPRPTQTATAKPTAGTPKPTPSGPRPTAPPAKGKIADGDLGWGVKESFRTYVTGPIANGKIAVSGGATKTKSGFGFPDGKGSYDLKAKTLNAGFAGVVRFTGHEGKLDLKFSDLKIRVNGTRGALVADVSSKDRTSGKVTKSNDQTVADLKVPSGALKPKGSVITLKNVPAKLTKDGAKAFGGFYQAGEALDPVQVSVSLSGKTTLPGGNGGSDGSDGSEGSGDSGSSDLAAASGSDSGTGGSGGITGGTGTASLASTGSGAPAEVLLGTAALLVTGGAAAAYATRRRVRPVTG
ncbi:HtaA domain-containing protein [Streptomyces sp. LX-29]|uniref:HtaA domain-containing protein n=1 Tax=Streptomyces sp. LX-29 TaxID=2900152 RepID=UPI00240E657A|nr:HtaA domain-containing protein [Streptomyces sp. LX-29]WFB09854.1 HtaA domain-containing protein [Streptomyces sp. LX-29]